MTSSQINVNPEVSLPPPSEVSDVRVTLARFETKLDLAIGQHGAQIGDHEIRLRAVEARRCVTPIGLVAALTSTVAILGGAVTFLDRLYGA